MTILGEGSRELVSRSVRGYMLMGDLKGGVSRAAASAELDAAMRTLAAEHPETNATIRADLLAQWQSPRGPQQSIELALGQVHDSPSAFSALRYSFIFLRARKARTLTDVALHPVRARISAIERCSR